MFISFSLYNCFLLFSDEYSLMKINWLFIHFNLKSLTFNIIKIRCRISGTYRSWGRPEITSKCLLLLVLVNRILLICCKWIFKDSANKSPKASTLADSTTLIINIYSLNKYCLKPGKRKASISEGLAMVWLTMTKDNQTPSPPASQCKDYLI